MNKAGGNGRGVREHRTRGLRSLKPQAGGRKWKSDKNMVYFHVLAEFFLNIISKSIFVMCVVMNFRGSAGVDQEESREKYLLPGKSEVSSCHHQAPSPPQPSHPLSSQHSSSWESADAAAGPGFTQKNGRGFT